MQNSNSSILEQFIQLYNLGDSLMLYNYFDSIYKENITIEQFTLSLQALLAETGKIQNNELLLEQSNQYYYNITLENTENKLLALWLNQNKNEILYYRISSLTQDKFIEEYINTHKQNISFTYQVNDEVCISINSDKKLPIASVAKFMVAIELAQQIESGKIKYDQREKLLDIEKFYIAEGDGAYELWINNMKAEGKIIDGTVSVIEIAKAMMYYSSNCNTEYLQELVGLDNINANLQKMGIVDYDPYFYLISQYYLYMNEEQLPHDQWLGKVKSYTPEYIRKQVYIVHDKLKSDETGQYKRSVIPYLNSQVDKLITDSMVAASSNALVKILQLVNSRTYFSENVYNILDPILGVHVNTPPSSTILYQHFAQKAGNMETLLAFKGYTRDRTGIKKEYAIIINEISSWQEIRDLYKHLVPYLFDLTSNQYFSQLACKAF